MTINQAKFILQAYRSDQDPTDHPDLGQALKLLEDHQELRTWFEEDQAFDKAFAAKIADITAPEVLKSRIQAQGVRPSDNVLAFPWWKQMPLWGAVASLLLVLVVVFLPNENEAMGDTMTVQNFQIFANQSLQNGQEFNARAGDWNVLVRYLSEHNTPAPTTLPGKINEMKPVGCMTLKLKDKPVGVICFGKNSKSHIFVINSKDFPNMPVEPHPVLEQSPYATTAYWSENDRHYLLVSEDPQELSQFVSF